MYRMLLLLCGFLFAAAPARAALIEGADIKSDLAQPVLIVNPYFTWSVVALMVVAIVLMGLMISQIATLRTTIEKTMAPKP